jgi:hypothetical protein
VIIGSNAGTHRGTSEVTVFSGCTLSGNGPSCHLSETEGGSTTTETLTTEPVAAAQVESVEGGHVGKQLLIEFVPASRAKGFVKLNFKGQCKIEIGQTPQQRTSWPIRFPTTPIHHVWLISGGVGKEVETGLEAFNEEVIEEGTALTLLASTKIRAGTRCALEALTVDASGVRTPRTQGTFVLQLRCRGTPTRPACAPSPSSAAPSRGISVPVLPNDPCLPSSAGPPCSTHVSRGVRTG